MSIAPGSHLGPYEVLAPIGAGGMGEVFRARDSRIGRDIAIKVLPASFSTNSERLRRFEGEARAAGALSHPNLVTIHDFGTHDGAPYLVMELLEGETLRDKIGEALRAPRETPRLSLRKAVDYGTQIASGLAAAHEKGIVHRDLKPENIFVTRDGRVKILDFGLAKLRTAPEENDTNAKTDRPDTAEGTVMGTAGYMSPEQVRGQTVDQRTDIFVLGAILYEMFSGHRAFRRATTADTMSAILNEEPPELSSSASHVPPGIDRLVRRCMEKQPDERFQSARDIAFALEAMSSSSSTESTAFSAAPKKRVGVLKAALAVLIALIAGMAIDHWIAANRNLKRTPQFRQLTFARGTLHNARFTPDGKTIVYSGQWNDAPPSISMVRDDSAESKPLLDAPRLLAVSSKGELAVLVKAEPLNHLQFTGTLARVPLVGGAPREIVENVREADWKPDGSDLAVVRLVAGQNRLECPIGKVLYTARGWISFPRFSPDGNRIAFFDHPGVGDDRGSVCVVNLRGSRTTLSENWESLEGLAWRPDGNEIWFTAAVAGTNLQLHAVTLDKKQRTVLGTPGGVILHDIAPDGRILMTREVFRGRSLLGLPGQTVERDISWLDQTRLADISEDGSLVVLDEQSEAAGGTYAVCIRDTKGGPPIRLGDGLALGISSDKRWVLVIHPDGKELVAMPTGPGETRPVMIPPDFEIQGAHWIPGLDSVVALGRVQGQPRGYRIDIGTRGVHLIGSGPKGHVFGYCTVSPDGRLVAFTSADDGSMFLLPTDGSAPRTVAGALPFDFPIRWADDHTLYIRSRATRQFEVFRLDIRSGERSAWKVLGPPDSAGGGGIALTADGSTYAYDTQTQLSDLFLVEGCN